MTRRTLMSLLVVTCVLGWAPPSWAGDNWIGTWKIDETKSQGGGGLRARVLAFEKTAEGIKLTSEGTDPNGNATKSGYTAKFDGTDAAWAGNPLADTAAPKKVDDNSYTNTWKKGGKVTVSATVTVSADGKTLTVKQTGTNPDGAKVDMTSVYVRQ